MHALVSTAFAIHTALQNLKFVVDNLDRRFRIRRGACRVPTIGSSRAPARGLVFVRLNNLLVRAGTPCNLQHSDFPAYEKARDQRNYPMLFYKRDWG